MRKSLSLGALDWVLDDPELRDSLNDDWELRRRIRPLPFDFDFDFDHIDRDFGAGERVGNHVRRATAATPTSTLGRPTAIHVDVDANQTGETYGRQEQQGLVSTAASVRQGFQQVVQWTEASQFKAGCILWNSLYKAENPSGATEEPKPVKLSRRMRTRLRLAAEAAAAAAAESEQAGDGLGTGHEILHATSPTRHPASIVDGVSTMVGPAGPGTFTGTTGAGVPAGEDISPKKKRVRRGGRRRNHTMKLGMAFARAAAAAVRRAIRLGSVSELQLGEEERTGVANADEEKWHAYVVDERKCVEGEELKGEGARVVAQAEAWAERLVAVNTCYRILAALKAYVHVAVIPEKRLGAKSGYAGVQSSAASVESVVVGAESVMGMVDA